MRIRSAETLWSLSRLLHQRGFHRFSRAIKCINFFFHRALLPGEAVVGSGLSLEHYALGVVIHPNVIIGSQVQIFHHVTIAGQMPLDAKERVIIGNRVSIGVNAVILPRPYRGLTVGDDAVIGAGAVVTTDVPAKAVMAGVPARILRYRTHKEIQSGF